MCGVRASLTSCVLGAVALLFVSTNADAFCRKTTCSGSKCKKDEQGCSVDGAKVQWKTKCVSYSFNEKGSRILDPSRSRVAVEKAFEAWSLVDCGGGKIASMTFNEIEDVSCDKAQYNSSGPNVHVVVFRDDGWTYKDDGQGIQDTLAKTTVTFSPDSGEVFDADMEVNAAFNDFTTTVDDKGAIYDLQAIVTHEVGHFIGIDHSDKGGAVMYPTYDRGSIAQRTLTDDDIAAVCAAYPPDRDVACDSVPRGGLKGDCSGSPADDGICSVGVGPKGGDSGNRGGTGAIGILGVCFACVAIRGSRRLVKRGIS